VILYAVQPKACVFQALRPTSGILPNLRKHLNTYTPPFSSLCRSCCFPAMSTPPPVNFGEELKVSSPNYLLQQLLAFGPLWLTGSHLRAGFLQASEYMGMCASDLPSSTANCRGRGLTLYYRKPAGRERDLMAGRRPSVLPRARHDRKGICYQDQCIVETVLR